MYTRTASPSDGLRKAFRYIMQVYGPCWFSFKKASKFTLGPVLLFNQMQLIKTQPEDVQETVMPVMQRNAYRAEPGVMLCSMLESSTTIVRYKALEVIKKLKAKPNKKPRAKWARGVRPLKVPTLQWQAFSWIDMNIQSSDVHSKLIFLFLSSVMCILVFPQN